MYGLNPERILDKICMELTAVTSHENYCSQSSLVNTVSLEIIRQIPLRHEGNYSISVAKLRVCIFLPIYNKNKNKFVPVFLNSALDGSEWSPSGPGRFIPGERNNGSRWIGDWLGPIVSLDVSGMRDM
jgi:hypothetical protein